jgi:hypothetical protein
MKDVRKAEKARHNKEYLWGGGDYTRTVPCLAGLVKSVSAKMGQHRMGSPKRNAQVLMQKITPC